MKKLICLGVGILLMSLNVSAKEEASVESEIESWYQSYADHWLTANPEIDKVVQFYASPFYYLSGDGPAVDNTESMSKSLHEYASTWKKQGWAGSKLYSIKVKQLNSASAIIQTEWDIFNGKGESLIGCKKAPWTYLVAKTEAGWKFALEIEQACDSRLSLD